MFIVVPDINIFSQAVYQKPTNNTPIRLLLKLKQKVPSIISLSNFIRFKGSTVNKPCLFFYIKEDCHLIDGCMSVWQI